MKFGKRGTMGPHIEVITEAGDQMSYQEMNEKLVNKM